MNERERIKVFEAITLSDGVAYAIEDAIKRKFYTYYDMETMDHVYDAVAIELERNNEAESVELIKITVYSERKISLHVTHFCISLFNGWPVSS